MNVNDRLIVYADFSSPLCCLTSRRVDALRAVGVDVDWRAVESAPRVPMTGRRLDAESRHVLDVEIAETRDLLLPGEQLAWTGPTFVPNTHAAVVAYAEAYGAGVADDVRRLLFRAYWEQGVDIGDPERLRTPLAGPFLRGHSPADPLRLSGYAVSPGRGPITTSAWRRIRVWQGEWAGLRQGVLPVLVENGLPVFGADVPRRLAKMIIRLGVPVVPELPEPTRYPAPRVRPSVSWAARAGGRWLYSHRRA
ncbi:DsbA family protein [Actinophytocola sp. NPDC049390]|uniref:DsbA family protein n=1 Tax=Actinophytocola sp. NPDC049390 TaxID=3363894 RepID=UPI0037BD7B8E